MPPRPQDRGGEDPVSTGWAVAPLAAYDSETTSADPHTAHLVTACVVTINDGDPTPRTWLANPGIDIPAEATAVHGITTEHAREHGQDPAVVADQVLTAPSSRRGPPASPSSATTSRSI